MFLINFKNMNISLHKQVVTQRTKKASTTSRLQFNLKTMHWQDPRSKRKVARRLRTAPTSKLNNANPGHSATIFLSRKGVCIITRKLGLYGRSWPGVCMGVHFHMSNFPPNTCKNSACGPDRVLLQIGPYSRHIHPDFAGK